jgi:hypothetical protein
MYSRRNAVDAAAGQPSCRSSSLGMSNNVLFSISSRPVVGSSQAPIQCVLGWTLSPEIKRQGGETDQSHPTSEEVKKMWIYTSIPPHVLMA